MTEKELIRSYLLYVNLLVLGTSMCATETNEDLSKTKVKIPIQPLFVSLAKGTGVESEVKPYEETRQSGSQLPQAYVGIPLTNTPPTWLFESSLAQAPSLVKGICYYWRHCAHINRVPSYHRLILVGKPGTGKTTLARAIAWHLRLPIHFVNASRLLGKYRNETAVKMRAMFNQFVEAKKPAIILIDELHKLFELHRSEHSDDSVNAAAFWLALDEIEQVAPYLIVIGTANSVDSLPPELKSRFQGKVVTIPLPSKKQRIDAFFEILKHDVSVRVGISVNRNYISNLLDNLQDQALRDIQLLIDTAKMCKYAEHPTDMPLVLERKHFDLAFEQLRGESLVLQEGWIVRWTPTLKNTALMLAVIVNIGTVIRMAHEGSYHMLGLCRT